MTDRGCVGLPSVFSHVSSTCATCEARPECSGKVLTTLQRIRGSVQVDDLISQFRLGFVEQALEKPELTLQQRTAVASMPAKVAGRLKALLLDGFDQTAKSRFAQGDNPFPGSGAKHLHLAGQLLLAGGFTKLEFRTRCIERYGWSTNTAFVEVSRAIALLRGLGLTHEINARVQLRD